MTGRTQIPIPGKKFCALHSSQNTPSVVIKDFSEQTQAVLYSKNSAKKSVKPDDIATIKEIHQSRIEKGVTEYLLSLDNCKEKVWEPMENIPPFVVRHFEKTKETIVPKPKVKEIIKVGSQSHVHLTWDDENLDKLPDLPSANIIIPEKEYDTLTSKCNTRKVI